jgi:ComF family protein
MMAMRFKPLAVLLDFLYPRHCLVCTKAGAIVHPDCRNALPFILAPFCAYCGLPLEKPGAGCTSTLCSGATEDSVLDGVRSVFRHENGARQAVLKLKYKGVSSLSNWLVSEMAGAMQRYYLEKPDAIIPVPLHISHLRKRGYNQAGVLAKGLSKYLGYSLCENKLIRTRETRSQVGLDGRGRAANVSGAFSWRGEALKGASILLVDDVCTTGATLNECARVLKHAGANRVWSLTVTREMPSGKLNRF